MTIAPKVSVITPVFNGAAFLPETIDSVLDQSYENIEYILIDDRSTDNSRDIIQEYAAKDSRIQYHFSETNAGPAKTRNTGLRIATGEQIAFIDADDLWDPKKLDLQVALFDENSELGLVSTNGYVIEDNHINESTMIPPQKIRKKKITFKSFVFDEPPIATSSVMIRSQCISRCGYFDERYFITDDFAMWMTISLSYEIKILDQPLIYYRRHPSNISKNKLVSRQEKLLIFEDHILNDRKKMAELGAPFIRLLQKKYCSLGKLYAKNGERKKASEQFDKALRYSSNPIITLKTYLYQLIHTNPKEKPRGLSQ